MRIHKCVLFFLWKHIPNIYIFHRHVIVGGNTFLIHSRLQSLLGLYVGKHIRICVLSTYIRETNARIYAFIWLMKRRHMRVPLFSDLFYWIYSRVSRCSFSHPSTLGQPLFSPGNTASVISSARLQKEKKAYRPRDSVPAVKAFQTSCDKKELQDLKSCNVALCATAVPGSAMRSRI